MAPREIAPIDHRLDARVRVPGSKSITNRALLIAALADGTTRLANALFSDDTLYLVHALQQLGFKILLDLDRGEIKLTGLGGQIPSAEAKLYVGNSGTSARFLSAFLTLGHGEYTVDGDARMRERPIGDLIGALTQLGASIQAPGPRPAGPDQRLICPPVTICASGLRGGSAKIAGDLSSQFLSALLMVAPYAQDRVELTIIGKLNSRPYVDLTLALMSQFGVQVRREDSKRFEIGPARYQGRETYRIESDATAASYFFAAPAIRGGSVRVENISRSSKQGDIAFLDVLAQMGCVVEEGPGFLSVSSGECLQGVDVSMEDIPDTAQTLAVVAPFADTPTRVRGIASARRKETDRVSATCTELRRLGVRVDEFADGWTIYPCDAFQPATIRTYDDHRMAMSFALLGLCIPGVTIENPDCVSKTFPEYFKVLEGLR